MIRWTRRNARARSGAVAVWECLDTDKEALGFGLRRERERAGRAPPNALACLRCRSASLPATIPSCCWMTWRSWPREVLADTPALHAEVAAA